MQQLADKHNLLFVFSRHSIQYKRKSKIHLLYSRLEIQIFIKWYKSLSKDNNKTWDYNITNISKLSEI